MHRKTMQAPGTISCGFAGIRSFLIGCLAGDATTDSKIMVLYVPMRTAIPETGGMPGGDIWGSGDHGLCPGIGDVTYVSG